VTTDETAVTDIELTPDGRIFLFGASRAILELLDSLGLGDAALRERFEAAPHDAIADSSTARVPLRASP
jgi:hypothetical protein